MPMQTDPQPPTARSFAPIWLLALVVALVIFAPVNASRANLNGQLEAAVNMLAADGYFVIRSDDDGRRVVVNPDLASPGNVQAVVDRLGIGGFMATTERWRTQGDNLDDRTLVTGFIDPSPPPSLFRERDTWRGEIAYASVDSDDSSIPLVDRDRGIRLQVERGNYGDVIDAGQTTEVGITDLSDTLIKGRLFRLSCEGTELAQIYRVGDELVLRSLPDSNCVVRVNGRKIGSMQACENLRIPSDQCAFSVIRLYDQVRIERVGDGGRPVALANLQRERQPRERLVMRRGASDQKIYEAPEFAIVSERLANDLRAPLRGCNPLKTDVDLDCDDAVTLSIHQAIQEETVNAVTEAKPIADVPLRRAAVVMNAMTGEIAAMAGTSDRLGECAHPALCPFPFGSVGKPIFATAMLASEPGSKLAGLEVALRGGEISDVLGLRLSSPTKNRNNSSKDGFVDLGRFVAHSDNYYIAALALLSSASRNGATCPLPDGELFRIDGQPQTSRRQSFFESAGCRPNAAGAPRREFRPAWAEQLKTMFALDPFTLDDVPLDRCTDANFYGTPIRDASMWRALLVDRQQPRGCLFTASGQERQYLMINRQRDFRRDTISLLLGGGEGRMTTVKLAEAYARLATGRLIGASLLRLAPADSDYMPFSATQDAARRAVRAGMARTVSEGTAKGTSMPDAVSKIEAGLAPNYRLGVFAKTGTIDLEPAYQRGCPAEQCYGKAFAVTLAVYLADAAGREDAPVCAVTIAVNLAQMGSQDGNAAAEVAAAILNGRVGEILKNRKGVFCARN
jgi:cell division protein FtsI/penicillin-binding protein 2